MIKHSTVSVTTAVEGLLPEIRSLIESARHRAVTSANLSMVSLYWNVGRIVGTEIQSKPGRADYGEALLAGLAERLRLEYGAGFSRSNLQDMRRFHEAFEICQTVSGKSAGMPSRKRGQATLSVSQKAQGGPVRKPALRSAVKKKHPAFARRRAGDAITGGVMTRCYLLVCMISRSDESFDICQPVAGKSFSAQIGQPSAGKSEILPPEAREFALTCGAGMRYVVCTNTPVSFGEGARSRFVRAGSCFLEGTA